VNVIYLSLQLRHVRFRTNLFVPSYGKPFLVETERCDESTTIRSDCVRLILTWKHNFLNRMNGHKNPSRSSASISLVTLCIYGSRLHMFFSSYFPGNAREESRSHCDVHLAKHGITSDLHIPDDLHLPRDPISMLKKKRSPSRNVRKIKDPVMVTGHLCFQIIFDDRFWYLNLPTYNWSFKLNNLI